MPKISEIAVGDMSDILCKVTWKGLFCENQPAIGKMKSERGFCGSHEMRARKAKVHYGGTCPLFAPVPLGSVHRKVITHRDHDDHGECDQCKVYPDIRYRHGGGPLLKVGKPAPSFTVSTISPSSGTTGQEPPDQRVIETMAALRASLVAIACEVVPLLQVAELAEIVDPAKMRVAVLGAIDTLTGKRRGSLSAR